MAQAPTSTPSALNLSDIARNVHQKSGVLTMPLGDIREALGFGRMGVHVKAKIISALAEQGLRVVPAVLPDRQTDMVRIYDPSTELGRFLEAATTINPSTDIYLHEFAPKRQARTGTPSPAQVAPTVRRGPGRPRANAVA